MTGPTDRRALNAYLPATFAQARATRDRTVADFGGLDAAQLNWQPEAGRWSVAQCLRHLILSNEPYWPLFATVAEGRHVPTFHERVPLLPRFWAAVVKRAVAPDASGRQRTTRIQQPGSSDLPVSIVADFAANVDEHLARIEAAAQVDHRRTIVTSPMLRFVTYSLEDAVIISVIHLERHRRQAEAVMGAEGFPSG